MNTTAPTDTALVIKICGITNQQDARHSLEHGANALGFNFYRNSPRYITPERAHEIVSSLTGSFRKVGIFVDPTFEELEYAGKTVPLDTLQIHGQAPSSYPFGYKVWRAVRADALPAEADPRIEAYLIDTPSDQHGGSGKTFNWSLAADFPHRKIVAGGLNESNVADAIRACSPWGVDACSLLEAQPGEKDHERLRNFLRAIQAVANQEVNI